MNAVIGLFQDFNDAELAIEQLKRAGFTRDDIGILARGYLVQEHLDDDAGEEVLQGARTGALAGTGIGGILGLLASGVSVSIPLVGPLLAAGTLAATLGGAVAGAVYGSLIGALLSLGMREEEAEFYAEGVGKGGVMVFVEAEGERAAEAWQIMRRARDERAASDGNVTHAPVVGLFANEGDAYKAVEALQAQGFTHHDIEMVDQTRLGQVVQPESADLLAHGAALDRETGDALVAIDTPGTLVGPANYLVNLGVPEEDTPFYAGALRRGGALVVVSADAQTAQTARRILREANAIKPAG
ncbi:MAG TPA: hypothetical protein VF177_23690 [Anaerolineae bacterium]